MNSRYMDRFTDKVLSFIRKEKLISGGGDIVVGLSGGADSVALLLVLTELRALLGIEIFAVHVNHSLRPGEAERDEEFCKSLAKELSIPMSVVRVDVRALVRENGMSEEEAARVLRYRALAEAGKDLTGGEFLIAVAHHADDQAETILLNLLRGSGLRGLGGMRPGRDGIIRPLITVTKADILDYLGRRGRDYVTDSTNFDVDHTRNSIRHIILPGMCELVNPRAAEHIAAVGERAYEADRYLSEEALSFLEETKAGPLREADILSMRLDAPKLKEKQGIFRIYVIIEALRALGVPMKDWGEKHFLAIDSLIFLGKGAHADLPGDVSADNIHGATLIRRKEETERTDLPGSSRGFSG